MLIFKKAEKLQEHLARERNNGHYIGFVPTMGALHPGHLSLIEQGKKDNDLCVTSIFVNPTQFNDAKDLEQYPRPIESDIELLTEIQNDVLFLPEVSEMYPGNVGQLRKFDFHGLDKRMEGKHRPGHFQGVAQVVTKLLDIVQPDQMYLGQKDYQQCRILSDMVKQQGRNTEVVICPTIREEDGLAMSSRNLLLSGQDRRDAALLSKALFEIKNKFKSESVEAIKSMALKILQSNPNVKLEYLEIVDAENLDPIQDWQQAVSAVACLAARVGERKTH